MNKKLAAALAVLILKEIEIKHDVKLPQSTFISLAVAIYKNEWPLVAGYLKLIYGEDCFEDK